MTRRSRDADEDGVLVEEGAFRIDRKRAIVEQALKRQP